MNFRQSTAHSVQHLIFLCLLAAAFSGASRAQLGMTNPVDPPPEPCTLQSNQISPTLPTGMLPQTYQWAPGAFLENDPNNGGFTKPDEQNGRLHYFLRDMAGLAASPVTATSQSVLVDAVLLYLGLTKAAVGSGPAINADPRAVATAVAQLAVTGRRAYANFSSWHSPAGAFSGPQDADLIQLVKNGYPTVDQIALQRAVKFVLDAAYSALWAIRSNDPAWRARRAQMGWIAVSGEDDTPHRPVNVPTAPYPQYDLPVTVTGPSGPVTATTRYMVASYLGFLGPDAPPYGFPPLPQPSSTGNVGGTKVASGIGITTGQSNMQIGLSQPWALPLDTLPDIPPYPNLKIIVYVHGGGSRLEEAVPLANNLILEALRPDPKRTSNDNYVVVSFDMPNSAYGDAFDPTKVYGSTYHPSMFHILMFEEQYVINFIEALDQKVGNIKNRIAAVMGGSLGGNMSLLLARESKQKFPYLQTIVAWSPTSMMPGHGNLGNGLVFSEATGNPVVNPIVGGNDTATLWGPEEPSTRGDYFHHVYFEMLSRLANIPADPTMWFRNDWYNQDQSVDCKASMVSQSRFDRYEVYSSTLRRWTTAIDTEQAMYSFQDKDANATAPRYQSISSRLLLVAGENDCYRNGCTGSKDPRSALLADTLDIYGFTHDVANQMANTPGRTLFIKDTGHSIHDERPVFFAREIVSFLTEADINLTLTLSVGKTGLRWNSTVYAFFSAADGGGSGLDLNALFHPYPPFSVSPNNPCGACGALDHFELHPNTNNTFTWGLSRAGYNLGDVRTFGINFIHGSRGGANVLDAPDSFALNGVSLVGVEGVSGTMVNVSGQPLQLLTASVGIWQTSQITQPQVASYQPSIVIQPGNSVVSLGQTAQFVVVASGAPPLSYQWRKNGIAIQGATSNTYIIPAVTYSDFGAQFAAVVSNSIGSVTSSTATIFGQLSATSCPSPDGKSCASTPAALANTPWDIVTVTSGTAPVIGATVNVSSGAVLVTNANGIAAITHYRGPCYALDSQVPKVGQITVPVRTPVACPSYTATVSKEGYQPTSVSLL
jgi:pimeloyl-ACP methyl ester carboxylesterase